VNGKLGKLHLSLIRTVAAFLFGSCVISASATRFSSAADKLTFLTSRILVSIHVCLLGLNVNSYDTDIDAPDVHYDKLCLFGDAEA
jgi:hypothetical protein